MESQIPRRIPRVLPLIGHGYHVGIVEIRPLVIPAVETLRRRGRLRGIALKPATNVVVVGLLAPQQAGESLALDQVRVLGSATANTLSVELVRFLHSLLKHLIESGPEKILR